MENSKLIMTHNGLFHGDELNAVAMLKLVYPNSVIVRTRDLGVTENADIIVDIGNIYDPSANKFDHHQKGFSCAHANGTLRSSAGLIWMHYGFNIVRKVLEHYEKFNLTDSEVNEVVENIDNDFIEQIDYRDNNGRNNSTEFTYIDAIMTLNGLNPNDSKEQTECFNKAVNIATEVISGLIVRRTDYLLKSKLLDKELESVKDSDELVILTQPIPWAERIKNYPNVKLIGFQIKPGEWRLQSPAVGDDKRVLRCPAPENARGTSGGNFDGIESIFVHASGFIGGIRANNVNDVHKAARAWIAGNFTPAQK